MDFVPTQKIDMLLFELNDESSALKGLDIVLKLNYLPSIPLTRCRFSNTAAKRVKDGARHRTTPPSSPINLRAQCIFWDHMYQLNSNLFQCEFEAQNQNSSVDPLCELLKSRNKASPEVCHQLLL